MMKEPVIDEVVARKFLLGQLSPEEEGQIAELAFEDPDTFTFLESVEEDLTDEFLHDELSPQDKQHFEDHFLSFPGRRQELKLSEVLQKKIDSEPEVFPAESKKVDVVPDDRNFLVRFIDSLKAWSFTWQAIAAAIVLALLIFAVWLRYWKEKQPDPIQAGPNTPVVVPSPEPQVSPSLPPSPSPVHVENKRKSPTPEKHKPVVNYATILIPSAMPRSRGGQSLQLPPDAEIVPVGLALPGRKTYHTYEATLLDEAGSKVDHWPDLKAKDFSATERFRATKGLLIEVKTDLLKPDEIYRIEVTGVSSRGERSILQGYSFQAKK